MQIEKDAALSLTKIALTTAEYNCASLRREISELEMASPSDERKILRHQAYALYYAGQFEYAAACFRALVTVETNSQNIVKLAQIEIATGHFESAISTTEFALSIDPEHHLALQTKAVALYSLGRYSDAFDAAERAVQINEDPRATAIAKLAAHQLGLAITSQTLTGPQKSITDVLTNLSAAGIGPEEAGLLVSRIEAFA